jgi:hypothetical protein
LEGVELRMHTRNLCLVEAVVELVDHCYPAEEAAVAGELRDHWSYLEAAVVVVEELRDHWNYLEAAAVVVGELRDHWSYLKAEVAVVEGLDGHLNHQEGEGVEVLSYQ